MADIRIKDLAVTAGSSASDDYLAVDGSTNGTRKLSAYSPTFGGNLTVNGTGTQNFSGAIEINSSGYTASRTGVTLGQYTASVAYLQLPVSSDFDFWDSATVTLMRLKQNGNLLIGTTTNDTGMLQVNGTATVVSSGANQRTFLAKNSAGSAEFGVFGNGKGYIGTTTNDNFEFYSNNTLALTLDSSQNATFAGSVSIGNSDTTLSRAAAQTLQLNTSSTPQFSLSVNGTQKVRLESYSDDLYISTLTAGKSIILRSGNATTALTLDSSQNATFAGSIAIGNTVNTVSPTSPNRTITMVIGGTTYYIHAKTTND